MNLECDGCGHVQFIGMVPGAFDVMPDPHAVCDDCGAVGKFHSHPGAGDRRMVLIDDVADRIERMKSEDHIERGCE